MPQNKYIIPVLILALGTVLLGACNNEENSEGVLPEVPKNVRVLALQSTDLEEYFEISGPVTPVRGTNLSAQESGTVVSLPVAKGDVVSANSLVIVQDRTILKAEMESAATAMASQQYNLDKVQQLFDAEKVSKIELLNAESAFAQARSISDITRKRFNRAGIKAPFDGVLTDRYVELGQLVMPGQKVVRVIDPYTLKMEAYLTDTQVRWVKKNDSASVILGTNLEPVEGTVTWIGLEADRMTGKFQVELEIENPDLKYHNGVIGRARLEKNLSSAVIAIPRDAVVSGRGGSAVYVVEANRSHLRHIILGRDQGLMVIIKSGLNLGDQVVVRGQRDLREGNLVKITEIATNADGSLSSDPVEVKETSSGSRVTDSGSGFAQ
ncbi:efflux RND transporter periplasmic adaptor subunit [bacterium]|jgi:RND family efflux transporter MFP subunit|nr:efflux RND transporter periplasmic adaptor subunit [bacterium]MBT4292171.1 efflux RND transporter periplasmic adaptor subunit [bacterium]